MCACLSVFLLQAARLLGILTEGLERRAEALERLTPEEDFKPEDLPADMPDSIRDFAALESEEWAREEILSQARLFFEETNDWAATERALRSQHVDLQDPEAAADFAWQEAGSQAQAAEAVWGGIDEPDIAGAPD